MCNSLYFDIDCHCHSATFDSGISYQCTRLKVLMSVAWIDSEGSGAAFVFDGDFSAVRSPDGDWRAPAPSGLNVRDLSADGYEMASPAEAAALVKSARMSVKESAVLVK